MTEIDDFLQAHVARATALPFFTALLEHRLPVDSYVGLLRAMAIVEQAVERMTPTNTPDATELPRSALSARDLQPFAAQELRDAPGAMLRAALLAQDLQPLPDDQERFRVVLPHVIAASALGQPSVRDAVQHLFVSDGDHGAHYLASLGVAPDFDWQRTIGNTDAATIRALTEGARQMLQAVEDILQTLYPLPSERLRDLVAGLNPEAGHHAIPDDLREIQAALRAGETSLRQFPYYHERYGERGRRFTHSDSAWLVTLTELTQPLVDQQIDWLGRVLASRGMPRWLLALHLDILASELTEAVPERAHEYRKLHHAAERIHNVRRQLIGDDDLAALERDFDASVGAEWQQRLPHTGALLGAAVADEADGLKRAVTSVESWLVDPAVFPPQWIVAVRTTLVEARRMVSGAPSS